MLLSVFLASALYVTALYVRNSVTVDNHVSILSTVTEFLTTCVIGRKLIMVLKK
jgi:hypothetical protein